MATPKESYSEALRDPRWQKKRLEILARDNFECQICFSNTKTLNVHHKYYLPALRDRPWDYGNNALVTLCEDCHKVEKETCDQWAGYFINSLKCAGLHSSHFEALAVAVDPDLGASEYFPEMLRWMLESQTLRRELIARYLVYRGSSEDQLDRGERRAFNANTEGETR